MAEVTDHSVKAGNEMLDSCIFNASTYKNPDGAQTMVREILQDYGAAVVIPRQPLVSGQTYLVSISTKGKTYSWSFRVE